MCVVIGEGVGGMAGSAHLSVAHFVVPVGADVGESVVVH